MPNTWQTLVGMLATTSLGCDLVLLLTGLRHPGRDRPLRPDRTQGVDHLRRLSLCRQTDRPDRQAQRNPRTPARLATTGDRPLRPSRSARRRLRTQANVALWSNFYQAGGDPEFTRCRSLIRSTSSIPAAPPGCPSASSTAPEGSCCNTSRNTVLHVDLGRDDCLFYYTTCGWMMWNWLVSGLAVGATLVLYDGSPFHPGPQTPAGPDRRAEGASAPSAPAPSTSPPWRTPGSTHARAIAWTA